MNEFERREGPTAQLMMEALEDRNAATCFGSLSFGHFGSLFSHHHSRPAHTHHWTQPAHSHSTGGHHGHGQCGGHHQRPSPPPPAQTGTVSGVLYLDQGKDGVRDAGETGVAGKLVYADVNGDGQFTAGEPTATTAADGSYTLSGVKAGTVSVAAVAEVGYLTPPVTVTVQSGQTTNADVPLVLANNS